MESWPGEKITDLKADGSYRLVVGYKIIEINPMKERITDVYV